MKRLDAEKLLGGYATGTLTEAERQTLFAAALEHQAIFDALMDEEALRELLSDPEAKQKLLAVLSEAEPAKVRPFWSRPALFGLAASLFLVVTTSLMLKRQPEIEVTATKAPEESKDLKDKMEFAENQLATPAKPAAPAAADASRPAPAPPVAKRAEQPRMLQAAKQESGAASITTSEVVAPSLLAKGQAPSPAGEEEEAKLGVASSMSREVPSEPPPMAVKRAKASQAARLASASESSAKAAAFADELVASGSGRIAPWTPTLACLPDGRFRLSVTWEAEGNLYLLKRTAAGVFEVPPTRPPSGKAQRRITVFEFAFEPGQSFDLYLRPQPEPNPTALAPSGDGKGYWQRILPE